MSEQEEDQRLYSKIPLKMRFVKLFLFVKCALSINLT